MKSIKFNPEKSELGITFKTFDVHCNEQGKLLVPFRYTSGCLGDMKQGMQVQFETITAYTERGNHYHFKDFAYEEFYLIKGKAVLIVQDLADEHVEVYYLAQNLSYSVPPNIAHKIVNISHVFDEISECEIMIAKFYSYAIENLQKKHEVSSDFLVDYYSEILQRHKLEHAEGTSAYEQ